MIIQILNGLALGGLLLVLSSGLALIFGLRGVMNFAHGAIYMVAAYVAVAVTEATSFWVALLVTPVAFAVIGVAADRFAIRPLAHRNPLEMVLLTFGLTFVLADLVHTVWGLQSKSVEAPSSLSGSISVFGNQYPAYRLFLILIGIVVVALAAAWLGRSKQGLYVRACSTSPQVAAVVGIDVNRVSAVVVGVGFALAGLAGVLAGPYLSVSPNMGIEILVLTFVVVAVGGLGSLAGPMVAALVLGMLNSLTAAYVPDVAPYAPFLLMIAVLLVRPTGFAGTRTA